MFQVGTLPQERNTMTALMKCQYHTVTSSFTKFATAFSTYSGTLGLLSTASISHTTCMLDIAALQSLLHSSLPTTTRLLKLHTGHLLHFQGLGGHPSKVILHMHLAYADEHDFRATCREQLLRAAVAHLKSDTSSRSDVRILHPWQGRLVPGNNSS